MWGNKAFTFVIWQVINRTGKLKMPILETSPTLLRYLIVTIICEYKILRLGDSDDFAGINFCDFAKSS